MFWIIKVNLILALKFVESKMIYYVGDGFEHDYNH